MQNRPNKNQKNTSTIDYLGHIPPQAVDFEAAVLGAVMLEAEVFTIVQNILEPECFYVEANMKIYRVMQELYAERKPIDMLTVASELERRGELYEIGGAYYLSQLTMKVGSGAHVEYHAKIVFEKFIARRLITAGQKITAAGFDTMLGVDEMVTDAERELTEIAGQIAGKVDISHVSVSNDSALDEAYRRVDNIRKNIRSGVTAGLMDLDKMTCGWQKSNLIILAARPSMGKTAIMLHFAKAAAKNGTPVVIFSLEMSKVSLSNRLILSETNIAPDRFRSGYMDNSELQQMEKAAGKISELPMYIDDNSDVSIGHIRARAKALHKQGKCEMVLIDYLQLCREKGTPGRSREQEVSAMSREAKILAKELDIPVILLSQLSRSVEQRENKRPQLSDLRDSGGIEQDADIVMFIWRPEYYKIDVEDRNGNPESNYGELLIEKNRDGATGVVKFNYNVGLTQIYDYNSRGESWT